MIEKGGLGVHCRGWRVEDGRVVVRRWDRKDALPEEGVCRGGGGTRWGFLRQTPVGVLRR